MATYKHIFINEKYIMDFSKKGNGKLKLKARNRKEHGERIKKQFEEAINNSGECDTDNVRRIVFESAEGCDIVITSLLDKRHNITLINTDTIIKNNKIIKRVTISIPKGAEKIFLKKVDEYINENTDKMNPKHKDLIESIENIYNAVLESFWDSDEIEYIPSIEKKFCEVWLNYTNNNSDDTIKEFINRCNGLNIKVNKNALIFPEKIIFLIESNRKDILNLLKNCDNISKFKKYNDIIPFLINETNKELKEEIIKDLQKRTEFNKDTDVIVDIFDTGIDKDNPLINKFLSNSYSFEEELDSTDFEGHGTEMAGVVLYNDLENYIDNKKIIKIKHRISSGKILTKTKIDKELWGSVTERLVYNSEILNQKNKYKHIICMAVTSEDSTNNGKVTSWSATIDKLCYGDDINKKRIIFLPTGNIEEKYHKKYPEINKKQIVEDPSQSFNAITVGAYTEKYHLSDKEYKSYKVIANKNCISPYTKTSCGFNDRWSIKPDILMEGGNTAIDNTGFPTLVEELSTLTTSNNQNYFTTINATSAATAKAAWFAAQIQYSYPNAWPETIRALMIHCAYWPDEMIKHLFPYFNHKTKAYYKSLLRICGYGVPNFDKAINTMENYLTLISQSEIKPFKKEKSETKLNEMHLYDLPWPQDVLLNLGSLEVEMRVTLSYFIEPSPGEVGWDYHFRYSSYGLRFEIKKPLEREEEFLSRINKLYQNDSIDEDEKESSNSNLYNNNWVIEKNARDKGSIHSDIWRGTAADLATCDKIAVFPVGGWWKERKHLERYEEKTRYSLIISISTPEIDAEGNKIDIYTPVINKLEIEPEIQLEI
ncbi:S8 family peptidase [Brachyspira intermedia]|uniref:S8 family peptidase n=1 Tax=Brachyspira intermedia TaxID=84377 RepID=UPI0030045CD2